MFSATLKQLHEAYPNKFHTYVISRYPECFYNNPYIFDLSKFCNTFDKIIKISCSAAYSNKIHYIEAYIQQIELELNIKIERKPFKPYINLTKFEKTEKVLLHHRIRTPFILFNAGIKLDMPLKAYPVDKWEYIIYKLRGEGVILYQVGHKHDVHPKFNSIDSLVGKTDNLRDYFSLASHSMGSIGAASMHMHVSSAFAKPSVTIAGGREDHFHSRYAENTFVHSIGQLSCCKEEGCMKKTLQDCVFFDRSAACMDLIDPDQIIELVKEKIINNCC